MNRTIARLAVQSLFGQKRGLLLVLLPVLLILLAVVARVLNAGSDAYEGIIVGFGFSLVLPLMSLLVTNGVLGPEVDDGSIVYLLAKPVSRHVVAVTKLAVAVVVTATLAAGGLAITSLVLDSGSPRRALAVAIGAAIGGAAYSALFVALSAMSRRGMIAGLIYVLGFEGLLASWLKRSQFASVGAWARRIAEQAGASLATVPGVSTAYAWIASAVVIALGAYFAGRRLQRFELRGDE